MESLTEDARPQSLRPKADQFEMVWGIYDLHRVLRMNALYYGKKLRRVQGWNLAIEIGIALSTSATIGTLLRPVPGFHWLLWVFSLTAAVLGVLKPIIGLPRRVERLSKLWSDYITLSLETGRIVGQIQAYQHVSPEMENAVESVRDRFDELSKREDPYPNAGLLKKQQAVVEKELPMDRLWSPPQPA
jgi:hypothetical protein